MKIRLAVAAMGVVVWGYAIRVDDARLRLIGIIMLAVALALRFLGPRRRDNTPAS